MLLSIAASQEERRRSGAKDYKYHVDYTAYYMHGNGKGKDMYGDEPHQNNNNNNNNNDNDDHDHDNNDRSDDDNRSDNSEGIIQVSLVDIKRAYFNTRVKEYEPVFVQLPP